MKAILILSVTLFFLYACTSDSLSEREEQNKKIIEFIEQTKYTEAMDLVEHILVRDPYDLKANEQYTFLKTKIPQRKEILVPYEPKWERENKD